MDILKNFWESWDSFTGGVSNVGKGFAEFCDLISHPERIWFMLVHASFWITLIIGMLCLILYGVNKTDKCLHTLGLTIVIFIGIKCVNIAFL